MRTTINIQDRALQLGKRISQERGKSLGEVVSEALVAAFGESARSGASFAFDPPVSGDGGLAPGVDLDDTAALLDLMEEK
jgi:hypothetical protein